MEMLNFLSFVHQWQFKCKHICATCNDEIVPKFIEMFANKFDFDNSIFQRLWCIQGGASAHRLCETDNALLGYFQNRVISLNCGVKWLPQSPELTPCDFFPLEVFKE